MEKKNVPAFAEYALMTPEACVTHFGSSLSHGLSSEQVDEKVHRYGLNQISEKTITWWMILYGQVRSVLVALFLVIAVSFLLLGQWANALIVMLLLLINITVGFYQEYKASRTVSLLKKHIKFFVTVLRDQKRQVVQAEDLVPGDIVFLKTGDKVPADVRILKEDDLLVDESVLTGESLPLKKTSQALIDEKLDIFKAFNLAFAGTVVVKGHATGIVFGTGDATTFGTQFKKDYGAWRESALEKKAVELSAFIIKFTVISLLLTVGANLLLKGFDTKILLGIILFAIALMVSALPQALPVVITFNLSRAVHKLLALHVIVKRLSAVEDLGAVDILCVDKTGTLTENKLELIDTYGNDRKELISHIGMTILAEERVKNKKGFDAAMEEYMERSDPHLLAQLRTEYVTINTLPFDPVKRQTLVLVQKKDTHEYTLVAWGSYEGIAAECLSSPDETTIQKWVYDEGIRGRRVIAVASKKVKDTSASTMNNEQNLLLIGLLSFADPVKKTAKEALEHAQKLGVVVKVISGDTPEVCGAVAYDLGLIKSPQQVVTGAMLDAVHDADRDALINETTVFSRVLPEQKAEIIQTFQAKHTVGYMGDGMNDIPALSAATVALVVQGCPD